MLCEKQSVLVVKIDEKVFENAQVDNVIVENYSSSVQTYKAYKLLRNDFTLVSETNLSNILKDKDVIFKIEINESIDSLISLIEQNTVPVKKNGEVKDGIVAGAIKDVLFMNSKKDKDSHKLFFGKHLNRYSSTLFDTYFRIFNGNVNVSATELREISLPPLETIQEIGDTIILSNDFSPEKTNRIVTEYFEPVCQPAGQHIVHE